MELLVGALQEAEFAEEAEFRLGREGDVHAGRVAKPAQFDEPAAERVARSRRRLRARRTRSRRPVAGVNGTATCSFG